MLTDVGFELRHLRTFVTVAKYGSFTRAADELHIAQQAVSQQIRSLERGLGVKLLSRSSRSVTLTSEGSVFLADANRVLSAAQRASRRVGAAARGELGALRLAYTLTTAWETLPILVADLRAGDRLWAIGGVTGIWQLTHVGEYQGEVVASNILGEPREAHYEAVPRVTYTDPQAAAVGVTEARFTGTASLSEVAKTATYTHAYADSNGFLTLLSDGDALTGAYGSAPKQGNGCNEPPSRFVPVFRSRWCATRSSRSQASRRSTPSR